MIHISLFSGIGGFELAAEWMGWRNLVSCDINEFGNKVRKYYWPDGYCHTDIKTLTYETINNELSTRFGHGWRDDDIIITGGFPCQPYSSAGKRLGKDDQRHLWPEMLRVISEVKPTFIVGENVRGLTNWNGGVVFEEVCADLEAIGYEVQPVLLPACAVGAPHRRDRVWFVAYSKSIRWNGRGSEYRENSNENSSRICEHGQEQCSMGCEFKRPCKKSNAPNTDCNEFNKCNSEHEIDSSEGREYAFGNIEQGNGDGNAADTDTSRLHKQYISTESKESLSCCRSSYERGDFSRFPTQPPVCGGDDGLPTQLDNITFSKWRNESIKAYGNAIVPQVVYQIFKSLHHLQSEKD